MWKWFVIAILALPTRALAAEISGRPGYPEYVQSANGCAPAPWPPEALPAVREKMAQHNRNTTAIVEDAIEANAKMTGQCLDAVLAKMRRSAGQPGGLEKFGDPADYASDIAARKIALAKQVRRLFESAGYVQSATRTDPVTPGYYYCMISYNNSDSDTIGRFIAGVQPDPDIEDQAFNMKIFRESNRSATELRFIEEFKVWVATNYTLSGQSPTKFEVNDYCFAQPSRAAVMSDLVKTLDDYPNALRHEVGAFPR